MYRVEILNLENGKRVRYRLLEDITILGFTAPAGFVTDGASTPRVLWGWLPPIDDYFPAAAIHDYLLERSKTLSRKDIDKIFYRCLKELKIGFTTRYLLYVGVRLNSIIKHQLLGK